MLSLLTVTDYYYLVARAARTQQNRKDSHPTWYWYHQKHKRLDHVIQIHTTGVLEYYYYYYYYYYYCNTTNLYFKLEMLYWST